MSAKRMEIRRLINTVEIEKGLDRFRGQGSKAHQVQTLTLLRQDAETPALVTLTTGAEPP